jgi:hypothetical protein
MAFMSGMSECLVCSEIFSYNPLRVPSFRVRWFDDGGERHFIIDERGGQLEPVCAGCMAKVNEQRKARGWQPFPILPGAYEPEEVA